MYVSSEGIRRTCGRLARAPTTTDQAKVAISLRYARDTSACPRSLWARIRSEIPIPDRKWRIKANRPRVHRRRVLQRAPVALLRNGFLLLPIFHRGIPTECRGACEEGVGRRGSDP